MSLSVRYLIQKSSGQQTLDFRANKAKYTLDDVAYFYSLNGKEYLVTGSSAVDNIWGASGSKVDATTLLGGLDNIYLSGRWADYTKTLNAEKGTITFSREVDGQTESVTVGNGVINLSRDNLVFADGTVDTRAARLALEASTTPTLDASRTSQSPVAEPLAGDSVVRGLSRESGVNFALPSVGLTHLLAGSSGVDQVYVTPGATVDAVALLGGSDRIFLTGKWSDYTKTLAPEKGAIIFTREINGQTEKVTVANGLIGVGRDLVIFADGAVRTDTIRVTLAAKGPGATVADLIAEGAKTTDTSADDWTDKTFTRWDVAAPEIKVVAGDDRVNRSEKDEGVTVFGIAEAGGMVSVTWGGVSKTVQAKEDGTWEAKFESNEVPAEGSSTITATVTDQGGNSSDASSRDVNVDSVAPTGAVTNTVAGNNVINGQQKDNGVTVTGTAEPGSTVEVGFGGTPKSVVADENGNWSVPLSKDDLPADGERELTVTVRDPAGNSTSSTHPVKVDTAGPAVPVIGQVAGDDMVSYTERAGGVTVSGSAEAGSQVKLTWGSTEKSVAADANGNWSANFLRAEIPVSGKQDLRAVAVDAAGNESAAATRAVTSLPNPPAPTLNVIAGDDRINASERTAGVTLSGTALPGLMVLVGLYRPNGSKINEFQVTANEQGEWSLPLNSTELPAFGDFSVIAETRDTVTGHGSLESGQRSVNVDVSAPVSPVLNVVAGDDKVNGSEKAAGVAVSGTAEAGSTVSVTWGGQSKSQTVDANGQWLVTFAPVEVPADGSSTVSVKATDLAGNESASVSRSVTVDTAMPAPVIDVVAKSAFSWPFGSKLEAQDDDVVRAAEKEAGVTVQGTAKAGATLKLEWGSHTKETTVGQDGKWSVTFPANDVPADGSYTLKAIVSDDAGNSATSTREVLVDTTVTWPTLDAVSVDNMINAQEKSSDVQLSGTADVGALVRVTWFSEADVKIYESEALVDADGKWAITVPAASVPTAEGASYLKMEVADSSGNHVAQSTKYAVTLDYSAPQAPVIGMVASDDKVNLAEKTAGVAVTGTAEVGSKVTVTWGTANKTVDVGSGGTWTANFGAGEVPADGNSTVTAKATDAAGNVSPEGSRSVTVDTTVSAPTIDTIAGDDVVDGSEKEAGVTVTGSAEIGSSVKLTWGDTVKEVVAGADGKWTATFTSDQVPANGATTLRATSTDTAGNVSAEGSRPVTVNASPVMSSDLQGVTNLDVRSDLVLKSSLPVTLADGTWTIKLVNDSNDATKQGFKDETNNNSQTLTFTVVNGVVTSSTGGELSLGADGRSVTLNPKYDLDLSNKYHLEIPAGMFKGGDGSTNDALSPSFSTVTPGGYSPTGDKLGGAESKVFDSTGALVAGPNWVDISQQGSYTGAQIRIDAGNGDYAFVVKDDFLGSPGEGGGSTSEDGVQIVGDLNVKFGNWGVDDLFYLDQQDNTAPQNDLRESAFLGGTGHGEDAPLRYVTGSSGVDGYAQVDILLEPDLPVVTNSRLEEAVSTIGSNTGMVISG